MWIKEILYKFATSNINNSFLTDGASLKIPLKVMNTIFILTASLMNEDGSLDYSMIIGAYANKEDAKAEATKRFKAQKSQWVNSYRVNMGAGKEALKSETGLLKIYQIKEMSVK